jgi:hypothetical protein
MTFKIKQTKVKAVRVATLLCVVYNLPSLGDGDVLLFGTIDHLLVDKSKQTNGSLTGTRGSFSPPKTNILPSTKLTVCELRHIAALSVVKPPHVKSLQTPLNPCVALFMSDTTGNQQGIRLNKKFQIFLF